MKILCKFVKRESQQFSSNELTAQCCIKFLKEIFVRIKCRLRETLCLVYIYVTDVIL